MPRGLRVPIVYNTSSYEIACDCTPKYEDVARRPKPDELEAAYDAARAAGLWRFDERRPAAARMEARAGEEISEPTGCLLVLAD